MLALYVLPEFQGRGHGKKLMAAVEEDFCRRGVGETVLSVLDANRRARAFYESLGYVDDGTSKEESFGSATLTVLRNRKMLPPPRPLRG